MTPVTLTRADGVRQFDGTAGKGWSATCAACGRCRLTADDGRTAGRAANHAVSELARACREPAVRHYYRDRLPAGVRLEWGWRGERRPAHLIGRGVAGAAGEVGKDSPVYVVVAAGGDRKAVERANKRAATVANRLKRQGWRRVRLEAAAVPQETQGATA